MSRDFEATYARETQADVDDCIVTLDMPGPATVHVGELITLSIASAIPEGDSPISVGWAMPGDPGDVIEFQGYVPANQPQQAPPIPKAWPPPTPPSENEAWHFLHPGVYTLEIELVAACPDGEPGEAAGTFELTVVAPAITGTVTAEPVSVERVESSADNPLFLYRPGTLPSSPAKRLTGYIMEFTLTPSPEEGLPGNVIVVQTMRTNRAKLYEDGSQNVLVTQGVALDNQYPYNLPQDWGAVDPEEFAVSDAPTDTFLLNPQNPTTQTTVDEHYEMYVLFEPDEEDAIPVPLGKFPWQWTATATLQGDQLNVDVGNFGPDPAGGPEFVTPCEAPFWTEQLLNGVDWTPIPAPPPAPAPPPDEPPPMSQEADSQAFGPVASLRPGG